MGPSGIMTISIRQEVSRDLMSNPSWPLFSDRTELRNASPKVSAYTLTWTSPDADADDLLAFSAKEIERYLAKLSEESGYVVQLLLIHLTLQPNSAVVLHRGLWKGLRSKPRSAEMAFGDESKIDCNGRVRFVALGAIRSSASLAWMVSLTREFEIVVPILTPLQLSLDRDSALAFARIAFPPDGCQANSAFDWPHFVKHISTSAGIAIRQNIDLARSEISADFFFADAHLPSLGAILGNWTSPWANAGIPHRGN